MLQVVAVCLCGCVSCRSCSWFLPRLLCLLAFVCAAGSCFCLCLCLFPFALSFSFLSVFCLGIGIDSGCGRINDLARGACGVLLDSSSSSQQQQQPSNRTTTTHILTHTEREGEKRSLSIACVVLVPFVPKQIATAASGLLVHVLPCLLSPVSPPSCVFRLGLISPSFFGFSFVWISSSFVVRFNLITIYVWKFLNCLCNPSKRTAPLHSLSLPPPLSPSPCSVQ